MHLEFPLPNALFIIQISYFMLDEKKKKKGDLELASLFKLFFNLLDAER